MVVCTPIVFVLNNTATTQLSTYLHTLSLHDALPISLDEPSDEGVSPLTGELAGNEAVRRRQRLLLAGAAGAGLILSSIWIFSGDESEAAANAAMQIGRAHV